MGIKRIILRPIFYTSDPELWRNPAQEADVQWKIPARAHDEA